MKLKYVALMLAAALSFGTIMTSCTPKEESQQGVLTSREVDFSNIGLKYTTPESWMEYTKSNNIYPFAYEEDYTIANIKYKIIFIDLFFIYYYSFIHIFLYIIQ